MKKFSFRLDRVLQVRNAQKKLAKNELLAANTALAITRAIVQNRKTRLAAQTAEDAATPHPTSAFQRARGRQIHAAASIEAAEKDVLQASTRVAQAQACHHQAAQRVESLERQRTRAFCTHQEDVAREEGRFLDDLTNARQTRAQFNACLTDDQSN